MNGTRARPGGFERREPALGRLVGRAVVRTARLAEPRRERLDHHPLRRAHRAQPLELGLRRARPRWRGGAGRSRRARASRPRRGSRPSTRSRWRRATRPPAGSASSGASPSVNSASQQPSSAPRRAIASTSSGVRYGAVDARRRLRERAVAAAVAAQHRERDEHLGRVGDARCRTARRAAAAAAAISSASGGLEQLPARRGRWVMIGGPYSRAQRGPVAQPEHALAADPSAGKVLTGPDPLDRVALLRARDGHDDEPGARDRGKGEREARVRVRVVTGGDDEALGLVERRASREQRRGVTVGPEPEVHEIDRRRRAHELVVPRARLPRSAPAGTSNGSPAAAPRRAAPAGPCPRSSRDRRPARTARRRSTRRRSTSRAPSPRTAA